MGFKCGIVGLPNVGKSTLFNCLSNAKAQAANFPFCTIDPNIGVVPVPDPRLAILEKLVNPQKVVPAVVQIVDIAGLVRGASKGEGLGNKFLANIRECEAILHVLRCFEDSNIVHVESTVNPLRDKEIIDLELQLKDLESLEKQFQKVQKNTKGGNKEAIRECEFIQKAIDHLQQGKNIRTLVCSEEEQKWLSEYMLLTNKAVLYVCNVDENSLPNGNEWVNKVREAVKEENAEVLVICAALEEQISALSDPQERAEFMEMMNIQESGLNRLIRAAYQLLGLQTYFTAGPKEVRAWTIPKNTKAPQAAGVIHSDFERGFIRAEVIKLEDYQHYKTEAAIREAGKLAVQGKDYVVEDGDIMHFRFNV
ncbi:MAG: redox-regulated ATPase YchF [Bacteroidia bacterium]|nr:redox-regulated ATPase YchF [Bacteroidia bacterium]